MKKEQLQSVQIASETKSEPDLLVCLVPSAATPNPFLTSTPAPASRATSRRFSSRAGSLVSLLFRPPPFHHQGDVETPQQHQEEEDRKQGEQAEHGEQACKEDCKYIWQIDQSLYLARDGVELVPDNNIASIYHCQERTNENSKVKYMEEQKTARTSRNRLFTDTMEDEENDSGITEGTEDDPALSEEEVNETGGSRDSLDCSDGNCRNENNGVSPVWENSKYLLEIGDNLFTEQQTSGHKNLKEEFPNIQSELYLSSNENMEKEGNNLFIYDELRTNDVTTKDLTAQDIKAGDMTALHCVNSVVLGHTSFSADTVNISYVESDSILSACQYFAL